MADLSRLRPDVFDRLQRIQNALENEGEAIPGWGWLQEDLDEIATYAAEQQENADAFHNSVHAAEAEIERQQARAEKAEARVVELETAGATGKESLTVEEGEGMSEYTPQLFRVVLWFIPDPDVHMDADEVFEEALVLAEHLDNGVALVELVTLRTVRRAEVGRQKEGERCGRDGSQTLRGGCDATPFRLRGYDT